MKKYNITVNGTTYQVEVEEVSNAAVAAPSKPVVHTPAPVSVMTAPAPAAAPTPAAASVQVEIGAGDTPVTAPMPGKVTKLIAQAGQQVKKGEVLLILEAMKMQNEIPAPVDGTVKGINITAGQSVKAGDIIVIIG